VKPTAIQSVHPDSNQGLLGADVTFQLDLTRSNRCIDRAEMDALLGGGLLASAEPAQHRRPVRVFGAALSKAVPSRAAERERTRTAPR